MERIPHVVLFENKYAVAEMSLSKRSEGAIVVITRRHIDSFSQTTPDEAVAVMSLLRNASSAICATYKPDGFHVFCNSGCRAGQSVSHMHFQLHNRFYDRPYSFKPSNDISMYSVHELRVAAKNILQTSVQNKNKQHQFDVPQEVLFDFKSDTLQRFKEEETLIHETKHFFAYVPEKNRVKGALVVVPKRFVSNYLQLTDEEAHELILFLRKLSLALEACYDPIAISMWWETGKVADQIYQHFLAELVPYLKDHEKDYIYTHRASLKFTTLAERRLIAAELKPFLRS